MSTGLIEGWQHFLDDLRLDNPLLSSPAWVLALGDAGFVYLGHGRASERRRIISACTFSSHRLPGHSSRRRLRAIRLPKPMWRISVEPPYNRMRGSRS